MAPEPRKSTSWATSSESERRRVGVPAASLSVMNDGMGGRLSVRVKPGATTLTRTPSRPASQARLRARPWSPDLAVPYGPGRAGPPRRRRRRSARSGPSLASACSAGRRAPGRRFRSGWRRSRPATPPTARPRTGCPGPGAVAAPAHGVGDEYVDPAPLLDDGAGGLLDGAQVLQVEPDHERLSVGALDPAGDLLGLLRAVAVGDGDLGALLAERAGRRGTDALRSAVYTGPLSSCTGFPGGAHRRESRRHEPDRPRSSINRIRFRFRFWAARTSVMYAVKSSGVPRRR